jgi:hypothetical protein
VQNFIASGRRRGRAARQRRLLWRAVGEAEFAVLAAQATGSPVRGLEALCASLRLAAEDIDRSLSGGQGGMPSGVAGLLAAARLIQESAASAIESVSVSVSADRPVGDGCPAVAIADLIAQAAQSAAGDSSASGNGA